MRVNDFNKEFEFYGFIQGDGSLGRLSSSEHKGLEIHIGKKDLDICDYFNLPYPKDRSVYYNENDILNNLRKLEFSSEQLPNREFPKTFNGWSETEKVSFIRGLYSANGSFIKAGRISFKTTCKKLSEELSSYLFEIGFHPYITTNKPKSVKFSNGTYLCKESYDINIARKSEVYKFYKEIGFIHKYKMTNIEEYLKKKGFLNED